MRTIKQYFTVQKNDGQCPADWGVRAAEVFMLVVQHCSNTAATVCSLLQVNAACYASLQQVRGQCEVKIQYNYNKAPEAFLQRVTSFSSWLPKYAGLVSDVHFWDDNLLAPGASQNLFSALSSCTQQPPAAATEAAAVSGASCLRLQLNRFDAHCDPTPNLLRSLAAAGLQKFSVSVPPYRVTPPFCAALGAMTSLQELELIGSDEALPRSIIAALRDLIGLTSLDVCIEAADVVGLPPVLRALTVEVFDSEEDGEGSEEGDKSAVLADFRGLTNLTHLKWHQDNCEIDDNSRPYNVGLPSCLGELVVRGAIVIHGVSGVSRLEVHCNSAVTLSVLECLPRMTVPFLLLLHLSADTETPKQKAYGRALHTAAEMVSSCAVLTRFGVTNQGSPPAPSAPWCSALAQLSGLQELSLCDAPAKTSELLLLSCLTGLKRLQSTCDLDDHLAISVLSCLVGLSDLALNCSGLRSMGVLCAVSRLTKLTSLVTTDWGLVPMKDYHLQHFYPLKLLLVLNWLPMQLCSKPGIAALRAELPGLTKLNGEGWG